MHKQLNLLIIKLELRLGHIKENITVYYEVLNFCNQDGICNGSETYLSCWDDCKSYSPDGLCLNYTGDGCDPDCAESIDPDCDDLIINGINVTMHGVHNYTNVILSPFFKCTTAFFPPDLIPVIPLRVTVF